MANDRRNIPEILISLIERARDISVPSKAPAKCNNTPTNPREEQ